MRHEKLGARLQREVAAAALSLVVLHGSRARGEERTGSDWDVGVLADAPPDLAGLAAALSVILGTDDIDVVDLRSAGALLRYRAARDGVVLLERVPGEFLRFQLDAVQFWCDAGWVIRRAHEDVLQGLG